MKRMMKILIKRGITIVVAVGMLSMSVPTTVFADEVTDETVIDPNELLSEDELPEGAKIIDAPDDSEIHVYRYDENGELVPVEPVFENDDPEITEDPTGTADSEGNVDPAEKPEKNTETENPADEITGQPGTEQSDNTESYGPLTPDGNLALIDDYGTETKAGKQFITVQTKSGAYFYLIIDRDDNGNETVHFLNQVDEADILKMLEDEEVTAYEERKTALEEKKATLAAEERAINAGITSPAPITGTEPETGTGTGQGGSQTKQPLKLNSSSLMIVAVVAIAGIGGFVYIKVIKKKQKPVTNTNYEQDTDDWDDDRVDSELADVPDAAEESKDE